MYLLSTQLDPLLHPPVTHCIPLRYKYIDLYMYLFTQGRGGGGGGEPVIRLEGQYFRRGVENTN
jgi:hypothetical protein